jgi:hypothetical protein
VNVHIPLDERHEATTRNLCLLSIEPQMLLGFFKALCEQPRTYEAKGLPADASVVSISVDSEKQLFVLLLESAAFAPVMPGYQIPSLSPRLEFTEHHLVMEPVTR